MKGFGYKLSIKDNKLSAFQMLFSNGVIGKILKAKNETEKNMKIVLLKEG